MFYLLRGRRFAPFFYTQFLSAFNDNLFKNAVIVLFAFEAAQGNLPEGSAIVSIGAALFILPFFLFSSFAGQLADKYNKTRMIQILKFAEIVIGIFALFGLYRHHTNLLLVLLFTLGVQAAFFSPVKYSFLPHHLGDEELMRGNGLLEMGTFLAILLGTLMGTLLMGFRHGARWVAMSVLLIAIIGWLSCLRIPNTPPCAPQLRIIWNPFKDMAQVLRLAYTDRFLFFTILCLSWFWFFGALFLAQIPSYTFTYVGGNAQLVAIFLGLFTASISLGSLLCDRINSGFFELGSVPFGMIGLSAFTWDLACSHLMPVDAIAPLSTLLWQPDVWRLCIDIAGLGLFSGFYVVPLYTIMQKRPVPEIRSRVIAANNIINALFMVLASAIALIALKVGLSLPELFQVVGIFHAIIALFLFYHIPELVLRSCVCLITRLLYRIQATGMAQMPIQGPAIIVCNHVSFVDPLVIVTVCRRMIRFVMYHTYHKIPLFGFLTRIAKTILIAPANECVTTRERAYNQIITALQRGEFVVLFPEGGLTKDGAVQPFRPGILQVLARYPVPVIPIAISGLWGSRFSRQEPNLFRRLCRFPWPRKLQVRIGQPIPAGHFDLAACEAEIKRLRGAP